MNERRLPDLWWIQGQHYMPQAYTCPLLMTLAMWWARLKGKDVHWYKGSQNEAGAWLTSARVFAASKPVGVNGKRNLWEISSGFPRWLILKECAFWNTRLGGEMRRQLVERRFA